MKPTAKLIINFFYNICVNSSLNCYLGRHACRAKNPPELQPSAAAQREKEARTARILHQGVMQIRLRLRLHSHSPSPSPSHFHSHLL
jgi:hypothetical protein